MNRHVLLIATAFATYLGLFSAVSMAGVMAPEAVVDSFSRLMETHHAMEGVDKYVSARYVEHDPSTEGGGREGLIKFIKESGWDEGKAAAAVIHRDRTIASGDLVVVHQHMRMSAKDPWVALVDIFRVADGKIIEHWDVVQPVPTNPVNKKYPMY